MPTRKIKVGLVYFVSSYIHIFHTVEMAAVEKLRSVINERLAAAADEIYGVFAQALSAYEEEICRQRRLLDTVLKPQIKLHRTELPQQHVCNEEEVLTDQQLCSQERNSSLDQEDPEPPQIKEEQEELCTSQEEEQLGLKQETDVFMVTLTDEESVHSGQTCAKESVGKPQIKLHRTELPQQHVCNEEEVLTDQQLCSQERNSSLDQEDPEPPQIKEEQEELCTSQEEEQLGLKQETDVFMVTLTDEESVHSGQTCAKESVGKPQIKLHRIELPQQHVCNEDEVLTDQQLCSQERNSSLDQEDPEPPQIKEELCTRQEEEQLEPKQETDVFMVTLTDEESVHSGQTCAKESVGNMPVISIVVSEAQSNLQLICHNSNDAGLTRTADPEINKIHHKTKMNKVNNANLSDMQRKTCTMKNNLKCETCGKDFKYMSVLRRHMTIHTDEKPYSCQTCGRGFRESSSLMYHMRVHTNEKKYTCKTCEKKFRFNIDFESHMGIHTGDMPYVCMTCEKSFNEESKLKRHMKVHTANLSDKQHNTCTVKNFKCETCGKDFKCMSKLQRHMTTHTDVKPYSCQTCGRGFRENSNLMQHMRVHENKFTCKTCGNKFRFNIDFKNHVTICTGEKKYDCKTCGKKFQFNSNFKSHMRVHTGEKPYVCMTCEKSFKAMSQLKRHLKVHTGEKPYVCMTCEKSFTQMSKLKRHMRVHTGEKPFACKACGNNFRRSDELLNHDSTTAIASSTTAYHPTSSINSNISRTLLPASSPTPAPETTSLPSSRTSTGSPSVK
ncbi:zinc finger protein 3-like isoform X3 [Gymnodraco acuticeps]|uniref:Zinc finger protein 3-like isoform X3 n=1 Tax=Gymnodraco acuticeps TaxID=8218 RepID=A0A6P8VPI8_GYMAC|nr:zinc finger protein 3-like isoform X3 [Gymnodraco acuticeps]